MKHTWWKNMVVLALALVLMCSMAAGAGAEGLRKLVISEPAHLVGHLPLFVAIHAGYFQEQGLDVEVVQATGGAHVSALVSGAVWGMMGGVESNCLASQGNPDPIVAIVNCINRANCYMYAAKGLAPASSSDEDMKAFLQGKTLIVGRHGGSPNLLTRYLLIRLGLDPDKDVTLIENADAATVTPMILHGQGQIGNGAEPQVSEGVTAGIWEEPFVKFHDLGDYSYAVLNVKKSTIQNDPETCQKFVNAMLKALKAVQQDKELAASILKAEFPTLSDEARQATLDRAYADNIWSLDGMITEEAVDRDMDVLIKTNFFAGEYSYADLVDMQFVKSAPVN
jgi:NitT/TauT family transport system substrate-binding protein